MSANLDKSLDEIIGSGRKPVRARVNKRPTGPSPKKQIRRPPVSGNRRAKVSAEGAATRMARLLDASREAKVNVEGLPRDIKQDAVKVCYCIAMMLHVNVDQS